MTYLRPLALLALALLLVQVSLTPTRAQTNVPFRVYMTFEDGPTNAYTPGILDTLAAYNAKASFLIAGYQVKNHEDLLQREVMEGHAIVNHLWEEPGVYSGADDQAVIESYLRTEQAIRDALGPALPIYDTQMKMFWQPGGGAHPLPAIEGVQVITYNWHVNSDDCGWLLHDIDLDTIAFDHAVIDNVLNAPKSEGLIWNTYDYGDGVIIAFHDINRLTGRVLPQILEELRSAGATFLALPRPEDTPGSLPVLIGVPPNLEAPGIPGAQMNAIPVDTVRVRADADLGAQILDNVAPNTVVTAIGRRNNWIQVRYGDIVGWIYRPLLKVLGPIPSLPLV